MKKCTECLIIKDLILFHNYKSGRLGTKSKCKECTVKISKKYNQDKKEEISIRKKQSYIIQREKILKRVSEYQNKNIDKISKYQKKYRNENKDKLNSYTSTRNENDFIFYLKGRFRKSIIASINKKGYVKFLKTEEILGCNFEFFKNYIESQFKKGMHWKNIHIDHIKPMKLAKTKEEVYLLNHYTNLRPLLALDNLKKGSKIQETQLRLL